MEPGNPAGDLSRVAGDLHLQRSGINTGHFESGFHGFHSLGFFFKQTGGANTFCK